MDKKMLRAIPAETADKELFRMSKSVGGVVKYILTADMQNGILILHFFDAEDLRSGIETATFRTFHTLDDYISQDLKSEKTRWITAGFENMDLDFGPMRYSWPVGWYDQTTFRSLDEKDLVCDYFSGQICDDDRFKPWSAIFRVQREIRERRIQERHDRELAPTDELMATIDDAPQEFYDWVWDTGMSFSNYLIYKDVGKGMALCECTVCGKEGLIKRSMIRMRNNETGTCPFCGRPVTFKAKGRMAWKIEDERYFDYVEPTDDGFIFRIFFAWRETFNDKGMNHSGNCRMKQGIFEVRRAFYTFFQTVETVEPMYKAFEWGVYKQRGPLRWCPDTERQRCWLNVLYPGNLPEAWAHTPMKYSALEIMAENRPLIPCRYEELIGDYCHFPQIEWMIKMGLYYLVMEIGPWRLSEINYNGSTIYEILRLGKVNTRLLQEFEGDTDILGLLQKIEKEKMYFTKESLTEYWNVFEDDTYMLRKENRKASLHKICRYIQREAENYPLGEKNRYSYRNPYHGDWMKDSLEIRRMRNLAHDWMDYIGWCGRLGYNLDKMSVYLPKNFKAVHDRTLEEIKALEDRIRAEERRKQEAAIKKRMKKVHKEMAEILEANENMDAFHIRGKGLILIVPENGEEIRQEGENLHDCLQTYVNKVAAGQTEIFFIRKEAEPEKSYFAMEYKNGKVVQCRGKNNCGMTPEVEAFVKAFEQLMNEQKKIKIKAG
ncbi:MAG: PcfJ domain-containing protein [Bacteroidales bacterium]|nr:PcfJ domain-containing protein [Bacteroidales bacterium]